MLIVPMTRRNINISLLGNDDVSQGPIGGSVMSGWLLVHVWRNLPVSDMITIVIMTEIAV